MACFAEWMFYSAVAQIVLPVIAAYLLYRTLRESRKTNRIGLLGTAAARRANSAARKANDIAIESGKKRVNRFAVWKELMFFLDGVEDTIGQESFWALDPGRSGPSSVTIKFFFKNCGKTPAIVTEITSFFGFVERTQEPDDGCLLTVSWNMAGSTFISSGEQSVKIDRSAHMNGRQRKKLKGNDGALVFFGVIKYDYVFGDPHETGSACSINPSKSGS